MTHDRVAALLVAALAVGYLWEARRIQATAMSDPLGPSAFPTLLGGALFVLAACLLARRARAADAGMRGMARRALGMVAVLLAYAALLVPAGYLLATGGFLLAGLWLLGERLRRAVPLAVLGAGALWGLFARLLKVSLPAGWLFGGY